MPYSNTILPETLKSFSDASHIPFWLDDPARPAPEPELTTSISTDLLVIGAGFTGLWTAFLAKEENPGREVVILESGTVATGASGRNGGFMDASITHGIQNGLRRWPHEFPRLLELGIANLNEIEATIRRLNIECDYIRTGDVSMASEPYQVEDLRAEMEISARYSIRSEFYDRERVQEIVKSPFFIAGLNHPDHAALVNPAQLAWGLRKACLDLGVQLYENSAVTKLVEEDRHVIAHTKHGSVRAHRVALATNAFPPLIKRLAYYVVPVYDYVLITEPLTSAQRASIGWYGREGISDASRQFHYTRTTADGRILWGGYDAIYHWNNGFGPHLENDRAAFARLAEHFFQVFPQLEGIRFSHAWGGAIDTCSRFSPFWGTGHNGRTAYAMGYTGLGVGASRFGARVILDLLDGCQTERTALEMVRTKPVPFPPEPFRSIGIRLSRWSMAQSDHNQGRENLWLRAMNWLGLGFDS
ncbi:MAG TPA: FAD-dependent oxidoreductase [Anaerolineales bacterium]|nr:FAD-dependent oxidoreductase [Anaerolineales bacterium]